jgi:hypothetical protein
MQSILGQSFLADILCRYESIREFTITPAKQTGQLGSEPYPCSGCFPEFLYELTSSEDGGKHTISEVSPSLGTDTPASNDDDYTQAQKLGMGATGSDKGKC